MILYVSLVICLSTASSLVVRSGYSYGPVLLLPVGLLLLTHRPPLSLKREDFLLIGTLTLYFLAHALTTVLHGFSLHSLDKPSRFVLAVPVLITLLAFSPRRAFLWSGLAAGAIAGGLRAAWEELSQTKGYMNPIQYGNISLLLGVLCLAGMGWAHRQRHAGRWLTLLLLGACMGLAGSFLSGSRGGWIALPLVLAVLYHGHRRLLSRRHLAGGLLIVALLSAAFYTIPETGVGSRVNQAIQEVRAYFGGGNAHTSVGLRLEMWRTSLLLIRERPLLGWGEKQYIDPMLDHIKDEAARHLAETTNHVHNEYLDAMVKRGLVGLTALLAVYLVPLRLFMRKISSNSHPEVSICAMAGTLLVLCCMTFGLSQTFLAHNSGVMVYSFYLVVIWACLRGVEAEGVSKIPLRRQDLTK